MAQIKVNLVPVTSSTRIPLVANGTVDLVCGSATIPWSAAAGRVRADHSDCDALLRLRSPLQPQEAG